MSVSKFLKNTGWTALAAAIVVTALPAEASAQDRRGNRGEHSGQRQGGAERVQQSQPQRVAPQARPQAAPVQRQAPQAQGTWQGNRQAQAQQAQPARQQGTWQGNRQAGQQRQGGWQGQQRPATSTAQVERRQQWSGQQKAQQRDGRNNNYAEQYRSRSESYRRDGNRVTNNDRRDNNWQGQRRAGNDHRYNGNNNQRWDRNWRNNNRYDWQRYRSSNRAVFHLGAYYSPYRNYSYRRLGIGGILDSLFFGSRYWINDPWQYRLPEVYGPYRWVRYYDDALLVDIYSGEVVDVIYDVFW